MTGRVKKPAAPRKKANGYKMPAPIANGEVIHDTIMKKKWRIGPSIGVGGFGEIYSACDHEGSPKKGGSFPFVIKIEPHENGPLFVEKHFYCRNANKDDISNYMKQKKLSSLGMPTYFGNGSHMYKGEKYRYLVLERYGKDLWSIFKESGRSFPNATVFQLGLQMLDVLEYIHGRGYVHADIKGANILMGLRRGSEQQAYLVDFGLATRVNDKEFKPDPKCAHNGTIEYTSRDAHLGVATMRGDLEILGYNLLQWLVGELPWESSLQQPKAVQDAKEAFMKNARSHLKKYPQVPDALIKYFEYINTLKPKEVPDFAKCRQLFEKYLKSEGKSRSSKLEFTTSKKTKSKPIVQADSDADDDVPLKVVRKRQPKQNGDSTNQNGDGANVTKRGRQAKTEETETESENTEPNNLKTTKIVKKKIVKRKSTEPVVVVKVKKTKLAPKATPPLKKNHVNTATQTSAGKPKRSPRLVTFDSPICEIIGESRPKMKPRESINSSGDIFDDSFTIEEKKVKRGNLVSDEEFIVKRVVKKKVTSLKPNARSWKDSAAVVNGRAPVGS